MFNRHLQIKMVKETPASTTAQSAYPENTTEAKAVEVIQATTVCVVSGYTVVKSVNFFFRMAEHIIVNR